MAAHGRPAWYDLHVHIELSEASAAIVNDLLAGGEYSSAKKAVEAALAAFAAQDRAYWAWVNERIKEGEADIQAGRFRDAREVVAEARRLIAAKTPNQ
jgi:Arc/MetJ-type ribon-helix-helix transcriptional regulator